MRDPAYTPTTDADDLEEVEVARKPQSRRRAVISVRLPVQDAEVLSSLAARRGMNVSQFARSVLYQAMSTPWTEPKLPLGSQGISMRFSPTGALGNSVQVQPDVGRAVPGMAEGKPFAIRVVGTGVAATPVLPRRAMQKHA